MKPIGNMVLQQQLLYKFIVLCFEHKLFLFQNEFSN